MRREMDRLFDEMTKSMSLARPAMGMGPMAPRVDGKETDKAIEVHAELPGVDGKDVEVQLADGGSAARGLPRSGGGNRCPPPLRDDLGA
jgi:HSP20 family protein